MAELNTDHLSDAGSMDGGFSNPVFDAQLVFDRIMYALSRPGTVTVLPKLARAPSPVLPATAAIVQTLCDADTEIWMDAAIKENSEVKAWVNFHTGAPSATRFDDAQFAIVSNADDCADLAAFAQGTQEYPDRSATLIIQVEAITEDGDLLLHGPGIKDRTAIGVRDLPPQFLKQWHHNNQQFPRGVDVIFASPDALVCLPRTTKIREREA